MVKVPLRAGPLFEATENVTLPLPLPLAGDVTVIHDALLVAVHPHPPEAVTVTEVFVEPAAAVENVVGLTPDEHAAAWDTVTVCPATVSVPLRAAPVFAAALKPTEPSPVPPAPVVMDSHVALLTAVQTQPVCVSMAIGVAAPPAEVTDVVSGVTAYEHAALPAA